MITILMLTNAAACGLITLVLVGLVLHPGVHDGVVIKTGLISIAVGFGSIALRLLDAPWIDGQGMARSLLLINAGLAVVIIGYVWRCRRARHPLKRSTDWVELDDHASATEVHR